MQSNNDCPLCKDHPDQSQVLFSNDLYKIVIVDDPNYVGYLRVITKAHIKELSDLSDQDNQAIYRVVLMCEKILRKLFNPEKVNLASFGNMTPHVHWHIIPRFREDLHFPNPIWGKITHSDYKIPDQHKQLQELLINNFNLYYN